MDAIPIPGHTEDLDAAITAARQAGDAVMEIYRRGFDTSRKDDDSPVTEGDLRSHEIIGAALSGTGYRVLSEEGGYDAAGTAGGTGNAEGGSDAANAADQGGTDDAFWMVDPLDGTTDFVERTTGEFTVMIALIRGHRPVLGVIDWPAGRTLFAAQQGCGAFRCTYGDTQPASSGQQQQQQPQWQRISVSRTATMAACRMVGSRHHLTDREQLFIRMLGVKDFTSVGSSLKVARISSGQADAYMTAADQIKEWDTAASHSIITEAGGRMTDMLGHELAYGMGRDVRHRNGILATNGLVHDRIVHEFKKMY